jgi:hypothetical protein
MGKLLQNRKFHLSCSNTSCIKISEDDTKFEVVQLKDEAKENVLCERHRLFANLDGQNTCKPHHLLDEATTGRAGANTSGCLPTCW